VRGSFQLQCTRASPGWLPPSASVRVVGTREGPLTDTCRLRRNRTSQHPSKPVLARLVLHARRAADFLAQAIVDGTDAHTDAEAAAGQLFRPAPVGFDVRVRLCPELHTGKRKRSAVNARAWGVMPKQALGAGTLHARSQVRSRVSRWGCVGSRVIHSVVPSVVTQLVRRRWGA
jgi:hypothetical protein